MKTPTPQEQAEMLIEAHLPFVDGVLPETTEANATKAAIVTVEYAIEVLQSDRVVNLSLGWEEEYNFQSKVLTILKGKL